MSKMGRAWGNIGVARFSSSRTTTSSTSGSILVLYEIRFFAVGA